MTDPIPLYVEISEFARPYVEPLFLQDFFFRSGRSAATSTATGTFVRRREQLYCVTCSHVVEAVRSSKFDHDKSAGVLALALNAGAIMLGTSKASCFASPVAPLHQPAADIAIARIPLGDWDTLKRDRERVAYVDLDSFEAPDFEAIESCAAVGFPDKRKVNRDGRIKTGLAVAVAGLTRPLSDGVSVFQLHSESDAPHGVGFSGMSGGLVLGLVGMHDYVPVGILFEGAPSGEEESAGAIGSPCDIFFRCHLLTPSIFDQWIEHTMFPLAEPMFMAVVADD